MLVKTQGHTWEEGTDRGKAPSQKGEKKVMTVTVTVRATNDTTCISSRYVDDVAR